MIEKSLVNILVLDDEPFILKLLARILANQGYTEVALCSNGQAVLDQIDSAKMQPNLILLDLNMPEMDGIEFVRHLVERDYNGSLILISGEDERMLRAVEKLVQAHKISVLGYIQKPVKPEVLLMLLEKWSFPLQKSTQVAKKIYGANEIRASIKNGEFVNYYQPQVMVRTGEVVGVETLVRWHHPIYGMVLPDQFISVAEEYNLIEELTRAVFTNVLAQAKAWQQAGLELRVAINVSVGSLTSLDFLDFVTGVTAKAGVPPQMVVLEVTESQLMQDVRVALEILTRLRLKRFRLAIDDFGTGHSSLAQLRDIPFDELKIDQGFVHRAWVDERLRAIYDASLALAKQLDMEVVAEGVADQDDWDLLRRTGCDLAQGSFISQPVLPVDLPGWIKDWKGQISNCIVNDIRR